MGSQPRPPDNRHTTVYTPAVTSPGTPAVTDSGTRTIAYINGTTGAACEAEHVGKALDNISGTIQQSITMCQSAIDELQQPRPAQQVPTTQQIAASAQRGGW
ncbi:hypothetical protein KCU95_g11108, partial [Aureobasidium melanogenum]